MEEQDDFKQPTVRQAAAWAPSPSFPKEGSCSLAINNAALSSLSLFSYYSIGMDNPAVIHADI